jgi:hypothetical protein
MSARSVRFGFEIEDRICTKLETYGFRLERNPVLDHKNKLDFVILKYPDHPGYGFSCGVQVTTRLDDVAKQREFIEAQKNQSLAVTQKTLYMELSEDVDIEFGGTIAVVSALLEFRLNRAYANERLAAVRIFGDSSYQFYDLRERVRQLHARMEQAANAEPKRPEQPMEARRTDSGKLDVAPLNKVKESVRPDVPAAHAPDPAQQGGEHRGLLEVYYRQGGHGFIQTGDETYFFHINFVADPDLRQRLNDLPLVSAQTPVNAAVLFRDAGKTKPQARYKEARDVRLAPSPS